MKINPHYLRELAERPTLQEQCNRWVNGKCRTRSCMIRGGYSGTGRPEDGDCATCETNEIIIALQDAASEIERLKDLLP